MPVWKLNWLRTKTTSITQKEAVHGKWTASFICNIINKSSPYENISIPKPTLD